MNTGRFGSRGEWWVVAQFVLLPIAVFAGVAFQMRAGLSASMQGVTLVLAALSIMAACVLAFGGVLNLGHNLTAVPRPLDHGTLIQAGVYSIVRHPIYSGIIFGLAGWGLFFASPAGLLMAFVVFLFFDQKSRREEIWLAEKYADYMAYQKRVRKLIPCVY